MRVLLDTNVVLDVLLDREPFAADAKAIWQAHLQDELTAHITASTITDIFYVARRHAGSNAAWTAVRACLDQLYVVGVRAAELHIAVATSGSDFEDNVQIACASTANLDAIVTRDATGFAHSSVEVISPPGFLRRLASES